MANDIEAAARAAFVAHMESVGTTDVAWADDIGPVGTYADKNVLLAVEWERFNAGYRAALALVREKVREAVRETDPMNRMMQDEIVARVMGSPLPPPRCETCFGCGYIPGTYERPTCDVCGGTGKEAPRG